jgi:hypothetical protein
MGEELPPPLVEFLAYLQQTMDKVRGERERLIGILAYLTRLISNVSTSARLRKDANSFLLNQIHHLRQLDKGIQAPAFKAAIKVGSPP